MRFGRWTLLSRDDLSRRLGVAYGHGWSDAKDEKAFLVGYWLSDVSRERAIVAGRIPEDAIRATEEVTGRVLGGRVKVEEVQRTEDYVLLEFTQINGHTHRYWVPTKPLDLPTSTRDEA